MKIIEINKPNEISIHEESIEQQYSEFTADMDNFNLCGSLIQSYNENKLLFEDIITYIENIKSVEHLVFSHNAYVELRKVINAFLSNLSPFLTAISKHIDKATFEEITHSVYDNYIEYQLGYELRNVLQHNGLNIELTVENNRYLKILIYRKDLLAVKKVTAKTKCLLNSHYSEQIDLLNELIGLYKAQNEMFKKVYLKIFNTDAHKRLLKFHKGNTDEQYLYIGDYKRDFNQDGKEKLTFKFLHFDKNIIVENIAFYESIHT